MGQVFRLFAALVLMIFPLVVTAPASGRETSIHLAKLGLDSISKSEQSELWKAVRNVAQSDAVLAACKRRTNIDRRILKAASPCVTPAAVKKIRSFFRREKRLFKKRLKKNLGCKSRRMAKQIRQVLKAFDQAVSQIRTACSSCFWC